MNIFHLLSGSQWSKKELTYRVTAYPQYSRLTNTLIDKIVDDAFNLWSDVTPLTFKKSSAQRVDIAVSFAIFRHGDDYPFDGYGGTLAHAFFPEYGGDVHLDAHEAWTDQSSYGKVLPLDF